MKIICAECGKPLITAFENEEEVKLFPCIPCKNKAFADGEEAQAKKIESIYEEKDYAHIVGKEIESNNKNIGRV